MVLLLVLLNALDAAFMLTFLHLGVATELNPIMRAASVGLYTGIVLYHLAFLGSLLTSP